MTLLSPLTNALIGKLSIVTYTVLLLYLFLPGVVVNLRLFGDTVFGTYDLSYKLSLLSSLLIGSLLQFTNLELFFVFLTAVLLGLNITLLIQSIQLLKNAKHLTISVGGTGIIALVASGCASCGISILSVLGISTAFLPFHGVGVDIFSSSLLLLSLIVILRTQKQICEVPNKNP